MNTEQAEEYTQSLGQIVGGSWRQIVWAEQMGIPEALGLSTEEWVRNRLGGYVRLSVTERREAVKELTAPNDAGGNGLSNRQAAEVLGVGEATVRRDKAAPNDAPKPHVANNSGDNEWYTPPEFTKAAALVMGGIDLDPASSDTANEVVGALNYYTKEDDGLTKPWAGRVWMNPPYAQPLVDRFCTRMAREYRDGNVEQACVLVNNATETGWFQELLAQADAVCFPRGRVKFWQPGKETAAPLQGQAILYLGANMDGFRDEFLRFGPVVGSF